MLHIIKDTEMANLYLKEKFHVLTKEKYIDIVIKELEVLDPKIVINRITSDPDKECLLEPTWLLKKCQLLNDIDKEMKKRNTYQGIKYWYVFYFAKLTITYLLSSRRLSFLTSVIINNVEIRIIA